MSGAEFVAVLSVGASVIQVTDACQKVVDRIKQFRSHAAFLELTTQLRLFSKDVEALSSPEFRDESVDVETEELLKEVLAGCARQLQKLDTLVASLTPSPNSSKLNRTARAVLSFAKDGRVRQVLDELEIYRRTISMHLARRQQQSTLRLMMLFERRTDTGECKSVRDTAGSSQDVVVANGSLDEASYLAPVQRRTASTHLQGQSVCFRRACPCLCHRPFSKAWGVLLWPKLEHDQVACRCTTGYYSLAVSALHKLIRLDLSIGWLHGLYLHCSLNITNTVPRSNPGFRVLRLSTLSRISAEEAFVELSELRRKGEINSQDVDPNGFGYLEFILLDLSRARSTETIKLVRRLVSEGVTWKNINPSSIFYRMTRFAHSQALLDVLPSFDVYDEKIESHTLIQPSVTAGLFL